MFNQRFALLAGLALGSGLTFSTLSLAEEPLKEKAVEAAKEAKVKIKKGLRAASDATCTGTKLECAGRKGKHKIQNAADEATK